MTRNSSVREHVLKWTGPSGRYGIKTAEVFSSTIVKIAVEKVGSDHCEALARAIGLLREAGLSSQDRVLINPNIVEPVSHKTGSKTNPNLVDAIIKWCKSLGVGEIFLGEGPGYYVSENRLLSCFTQTGY